jgi:diguanylate cyclase (GGDEF)-like protein
MATESESTRKGLTRVGLLAAAMTAVAVPLHAYLVSPAGTGSPLFLSWWALGIGFLVTEMFVIHLHVKRDAHSASLSEIPLLLGLAAASPAGLVVGRLSGTALALVLHRKSRGAKLLFNLALCYLETVGTLAVYSALMGGRSPVSASGLAVASAALMVSVLLGAAMVSTAILLTNPGRPYPAILRSMLSGLAISSTGVVLALGSLLMFWREPISLVAAYFVVAIIYSVLRRFGSLNRKFEDLEAVHAFTSAIDAAVDTEALVAATLAHTRSLFDADFAEVVLSRGLTSTSTFSKGDSGPVRRPASPAVLGVVSSQTNGSAVVGMLSDADPEIVEHYRSRGIPSGMVAEMHGGAGTATLIVVGNGPDRDRFGKEELRVFGTLARQARVSFERGRLVDRLRHEVGQKEHQALHDALTGLPNRLHFTIAVEDAIRKARDGDHRVAVLLIDLDRFKEVNDTLGHQRGDVLLQEMSLRLTSTVGGDDHAARLGGDEFGVVLREISSVSDATEWARRIGAELRKPFRNEGLSIQVTGSIGIALAPDHGSDGTTLLRRADVAMYEAKGSDSTYEVYDPRRDGYSTRRLALAAELSEAIEAGTLFLEYQPKASLATGEVVGVEALARWHHPDHGPVPPEEFISLAERTGLIRPLTEQVMHAAFRDRSRLLAEGHSLTVAVNVAASSLDDPDFPDLVARLIGEHDVDPQAVVLEVTETTMMADSARTRLVLAGLHELGVVLSIDDFGTGYSSLAYLSSLPVDEVKIDRSFVLNMAVDERLANIVHNTAALVHSLGLRVVAEGAENRGTWELLAEAGCDTAQGYYVARPLGFTDLSAWLTGGAQFQGDSGPRLPSALAGD